MPSQLLLPPNYPSTVIPGTEFSGKGVDPITGNAIAPNGTVGTPAALAAQATAIAATGKVAFGWTRGYAG